MDRETEFSSDNSFPKHCYPGNSATLHREKLEAEITGLTARINAASYGLLKLIAEFEQCQGRGDRGCRSCAHWLNWRCGIAIGAARETRNKTCSLDIDSNTAFYWSGDPMDFGMAIDGLLQHRDRARRPETRDVSAETLLQ